MYLMLHWYREISHHTSAFALTHRPYHRMLLIFAGMVTSYVLLHYSLEQVDCDDLDSIVEEYSSEISNWTSSTDSDSTDIVISTDTNSWLYSIQNYWNQLLETREQKKSLDDEVCEIFIEQIHELSERSDFQIGLYVFMYLLAYTLAYIPMYILSYLFTLCVFILTRS